VQGYKSMALEGIWSKIYDLAFSSHVPILPPPPCQRVLVFTAVKHTSSN